MIWLVFAVRGNCVEKIYLFKNCSLECKGKRLKVLFCNINLFIKFVKLKYNITLSKK